MPTKIVIVRENETVKLNINGTLETKKDVDDFVGDLMLLREGLWGDETSDEEE